MKEFFEAIRKGELQKIKELLREDSALVNSRDGTWRTALHYAVICNQEAIIRFLLVHGAEVNALDLDKRPPLFYAIKPSDDFIFRLLLDNRADPTIKDGEGNTIFHEAASISQGEFLEHIKRGLTHYQMQELAKVSNKKGETALHKATRRSNSAVVKFFVDNGWDINAQDKYQYTVLHYAGNPEVVRYLLDHGANCQLLNINGDLAHHLACRYGFFKLSKLICDREIKAYGLEEDAPENVKKELEASLQAYRDFFDNKNYEGYKETITYPQTEAQLRDKYCYEQAAKMRGFRIDLEFTRRYPATTTYILLQYSEGFLLQKDYNNAMSYTAMSEKFYNANVKNKDALSLRIQQQYSRVIIRWMREQKGSFICCDIDGKPPFKKLAEYRNALQVVREQIKRSLPDSTHSTQSLLKFINNHYIKLTGLLFSNAMKLMEERAPRYALMGLGSFIPILNMRSLSKKAPRISKGGRATFIK